MQRDNASVAVTEHARDSAVRPKAGEAIRVLEAEVSAGLGHAETLTGFSATSNPLKPLS